MKNSKKNNDRVDKPPTSKKFVPVMEIKLFEKNRSPILQDISNMIPLKSKPENSSSQVVKIAKYDLTKLNLVQNTTSFPRQKSTPISPKVSQRNFFITREAPDLENASTFDTASTNYYSSNPLCDPAYSSTFDNQSNGSATKMHKLTEANLFSYSRPTSQQEIRKEKKISKFRALPLPNSTLPFVVYRSSNPLTKFQEFKFATHRRQVYREAKREWLLQN